MEKVIIRNEQDLQYFMELLPDYLIDACTTSGSNDDAVEAAVKATCFDVEVKWAKRFVAEWGIEREDYDVVGLRNYVFWLGAWNLKDSKEMEA